MENLENIILIEKHKIPNYIQIATVIGIMSGKKFDNDIPTSEIRKDLWNNKESKYSISSDEIINYFKKNMGGMITKKDIAEVANKSFMYSCTFDRNGDAISVHCGVDLVRLAQTQIQREISLQNKIEHTD